MKRTLAIVALTAALLASLLVASGHRERGVVVVVIPREAAHLPYVANYWPPRITLVIGINNTVRWVNMDHHMHTVTSDDRLFHSGELNLYESFTYTFEKAGIYSYTCMPHPWMHGYVEVREP
jgi:plastocyanin